MSEEKSVLDAAVEAMVDLYNRLEDAANGIWAVALELSQLNEKLDKIIDADGALKVSIDYEKLGDQIAASFGQTLVEIVPESQAKPTGIAETKSSKVT